MPQSRRAPPIKDRGQDRKGIETMNENLLTNSFIWTRDRANQEYREPCVVYFRKEFSCISDFYISANCRYKLYINGKFIQEGPQKGNRETAYKDKVCCREGILTDSFDASKTAGVGQTAPAAADDAEDGTKAVLPKNVAAVEVLYYPEDASRRNDSLYYSRFPCLYIEAPGELDGSSGWKYTEASGRKLTAEPFMPAPIHGSEHVSGEERLSGWKEQGYDDSSWQDAKPYTFFEVQKPTAPFHLKERTIPPMEHHHKHFVEVVCVRESSAQTAESLTIQWNRMLRSPEDECGSVEISANTTQIVEISAGEEMCGYPTLRIAGGKDAEIEFLYAESYGRPQPNIVTPAGERPAPPQKGDRTDYVNGVLSGCTDLFCPGGFGTREKPEEYTPFLFRTFRYIQVKITTKDQGLSVLSYDYLSTGYPLKVRTKLETSDETMNRIWDISLRSLRRCMHETYVDCPFYEQLQYTMDSRAEILFTYLVSADDRLARQCMEAFRATQRSDGILQASAPAEGVNVIPGFSIFYILMLYDHMMYFGDRNLLREHFGCMDRILEFFRNHLTERGLVGDVGGILFQHPYWSFVDWCPQWDATIGVPAAKTVGDHSITMESLLYLYGLQKAAEVADYIGRTGIGEEYRARARKLHDTILRTCIGEEGLIKDGPEAELYSVHCQVWGILAGILSKEQGRKNLEKTVGAAGIPQCSVSMSFYLFEAIFQVEWMEKAEELWEPWRQMLRDHMTTCVENFVDQRSDCHAWGAAILYALPALYLGIRPTAPGYASWEHKPQPAHLDWIRGEVATPRGTLPVDVKNCHK